jgi:hypothetical protein
MSFFDFPVGWVLNEQSGLVNTIGTCRSNSPSQDLFRRYAMPLNGVIAIHTLTEE